jgi:endoribonuclease Dicer
VIWLKPLNYCFDISDDLREELHEMLTPTVLKPSKCKLDCLLNLHFYYVQFIPIPADRNYRIFGLFVINPLPTEAEKLEVDLHLARGRIVKAGMRHLGTISFNEEQASSCSLFHTLTHYLFMNVV